MPQHLFCLEETTSHHAQDHICQLQLLQSIFFQPQVLPARPGVYIKASLYTQAVVFSVYNMEAQIEKYNCTSLTTE